MLKDLLTNHNLILGSGSPRRQKFLEDMELPFVKLLKPIEEDYPKHLVGPQIPEYLSKLKAEPFKKDLDDQDILFTSDTIVWHNDLALGKPNNAEDAFKMLKSMSGTSHLVISSICFTTTRTQLVKSATTKVKFKTLSDLEITHYISKYKPFDKAGGYGIQEWIGKIGIIKIDGSYENVVGLPTQLFYDTLSELITTHLQ